jgi:hypothetical protein
MSVLQNSQVASLQPVKFILNWGRRYSLWLLNFGLACCGIELIASAMPKHDLIRFGVRVILKVRDGAGGDYWWVECSGCDTAWQVPYFAESVG